MTSSKPANPWLPEVLLGFPESRVSANAVAASLGVPYADVSIHVFPDGESRVRIADVDAVRGKRVAMFRSLDHANGKIIELILTASILGADADITLIAPYLPYMRQDKAFNPGEAMSQTAIGGLLARHFSRFISFDPHLHRTRDLGAVFASKPARALSAAEVMASYIRHAFPRGIVLLGPDEESGPLVGKVAVLAGCEWSVARKHRLSDRQVKIMLPETLSFANRTVVIIDDVISSGHTIATVAAALIIAGAARIAVCATHALHDQAAADAMAAAGVDLVASSDTIPHPSNRFSIIDTLAWNLKDPHDS